MSRSSLFAGICALVLFAVTICQPAFAAAKYAHEREWIVDFIGRDVAEMTLFAAKKNGDDVVLTPLDYKTAESDSDQNAFTYELKVNASSPVEKRNIVISDYIWSPSNYSPIATYLMSQLKLKPATSEVASSTDFIKELSKCNSEVLVREDKRLTEELSKNPLDPNLHEQAALLCACWELREWSDSISDPRPLLNRTAAHLAMASALRPNSDYSDAGKLANMTLLCLAGRTADCLSESDKLKATSKDEATLSWLRGLRYRSTCDTRVPVSDSATMMEQFEYGKQVALCRSAADYLEFYRSRKNSAEAIDWIRGGLNGRNSVEAGYIFAEPGLQLEMKDFMQDYQLYHNSTERPDPISELNNESTRCLMLDGEPHLEPVSWQTIAALHTRQIIGSAIDKHHFELKDLGAPQQAVTTSKQADALFSKMFLYPILDLELQGDSAQNMNDRASADTSEKVAKLIDERPELINPHVWNNAKAGTLNREKLPEPDTWFAPLLPLGTAIQIIDRARDPAKFTLAQAEELTKISPYNYYVRTLLCYKRFGNDPTPDQFLEAHGPRALYDTTVIDFIVNEYKAAQQWDKQTKYMESVVALDPPLWFELGNRYADRKEMTKAVDAFEKGMKLNHNTVLVANNSKFLVTYYLDQKQNDKALKLAKEAADVYSHRGLTTLAYTYERLGDLKNAEEWYKKVMDRYDASEPLVAFYLRHEKVDPRYKSEAKRLSVSTFPNGFVLLKNPPPSTPPTAGIKIALGIRMISSYGFTESDIIAGLDGYKIDNVDQFNFVRDMKDGEQPLQVLVWNGKSYRTITAYTPSRRLRAQFANYNAMKTQ